MRHESGSIDESRTGGSDQRSGTPPVSANGTIGMQSGNDNQIILGRVHEIKHRLSADVTRLLEKNYEMDMNLADKVVSGFFREGYLPAYYFLSNSAEEIAGHVFITTQILNANTEFITHESRDGKVLTYFVNVGRDFPGKLARIMEENILMDIVSFNSVKTESGVRIIILEKTGRATIRIGGEKEFMALAEREIRPLAGDKADRFLQSLPMNYLNEEIDLVRAQSRIKRHLSLFMKALETNATVVGIEEGATNSDCLDCTGEQRISMAARNPGRRFVLNVLRVFEKHGVNIHRSYFDLFENRQMGDRVAILTLYTGSDSNVRSFSDEIASADVDALSGRELSETMVSNELEFILRTISDDRNGTAAVKSHLGRIRDLVRTNADLSSPGEMNNFLLNVITDFYKAAEFIGIHKNDELLRDLLRFDSLGEFYVLSQNGQERRNLPGYRFAHNSIRGPHKGGLRLDPIVRFDEVCALSFMMTWKTARTRLLFGGAKGGLVINPRDFNDNRLDFFDTLANFGRSLFILTGPMRDVPAGDVGCGAEEIGVLFEGFKSALRDLVLTAHGLKRGVPLIGHRVIPVDEARDILQNSFDLDWTDRRVLEKLASSERYLELITSAQITGKPRMGVPARNGATGRGLLYSIMAMMGRLYLEGRWDCSGKKPDAGGEALLRKAAHYADRRLASPNRDEMMTADEWTCMCSEVYPLLFADKRIIVQGTGAVGGSVLRELERFNVNIVAVGDAGGAIVGDHLNIDEILMEAVRSPARTCIGARENVSLVIEGASAGATILNDECDILLLCAMENVVTAPVAAGVKASLVASGGNGTTTSKGEQILNERGLAVVYDFIANSGGVAMSYFEWLRNLADRFQYESDMIYGRPFNVDAMDRYIMPEFADRIKRIIAMRESESTTREWNALLRDIIFCAVNEDYEFARQHSFSMKTAGFVQAILRVVAVWLAKSGEDQIVRRWNGLSEKTRDLLEPFLRHPEVARCAPENQALLRAVIGETNESREIIQ